MVCSLLWEDTPGSVQAAKCRTLARTWCHTCTWQLPAAGSPSHQQPDPQACWVRDGESNLASKGPAAATHGGWPCPRGCNPGQDRLCTQTGHGGEAQQIKLLPNAQGAASSSQDCHHRAHMEAPWGTHSLAQTLPTPTPWSLLWVKDSRSCWEL